MYLTGWPAELGPSRAVPLLIHYRGGVLHIRHKAASPYNGQVQTAFPSEGGFPPSWLGDCHSIASHHWALRLYTCHSLHCPPTVCALLSFSLTCVTPQLSDPQTSSLYTIGLPNTSRTRSPSFGPMPILAPSLQTSTDSRAIRCPARYTSPRPMLSPCLIFQCLLPSWL